MLRLSQALTQIHQLILILTSLILFSHNEGFIHSFCFISTEQSLEELKKLLLLLLGCAVQVNADDVHKT